MLGSVSADPPMARRASFRTTSLSRIPRRSQIPKKCSPLPLFGALTIADVHGRGVEVPRRKGGADAGVHPATKQDNRARFGVIRHIEHCTTESQRHREIKK